MTQYIVTFAEAWEKIIVLCIVTHHHGRICQKRKSTTTYVSSREQATTTYLLLPHMDTQVKRWGGVIIDIVALSILLALVCIVATPRGCYLLEPPYYFKTADESISQRGRLGRCQSRQSRWGWQGNEAKADDANEANGPMWFDAADKLMRLIWPMKPPRLTRLIWPMRPLMTLKPMSQQGWCDQCDQGGQSGRWGQLGLLEAVRSNISTGFVTRHLTLSPLCRI